MLNYEEDDRSDRGVERVAALRNGRHYRWTCPICGDSRASVATGGDDEFVVERAKTALLAHVRATEDAPHGPRHSVPEDFRHDRPDQFVELEDGSR